MVYNYSKSIMFLCDVIALIIIIDKLNSLELVQQLIVKHNIFQCFKMSLTFTTFVTILNCQRSFPHFKTLGWG